MRLVRIVKLIVVVALVNLVVGCGNGSKASGPKTLPVRGKVVFTKGGDVKTLFDRQARIELESLDQPGVRAVGTIEEDGGFTVATVADSGSSVGAVPGTHRVRFLLDERDERFVAPQFLNFQKSGITVKVPSEEPIEIKVWR
ncbi:MAG TPA: hypothetical protein VGI40_15750 [Pirellulaceae bacterium]|jgi:hypothetical protein